MRQQIIARITRSDFHNLASRPDLFNVFLKDNLHGVLFSFQSFRWHRRCSSSRSNRDEGFPMKLQKNPASEDAGYSKCIHLNFVPETLAQIFCS
jgi:hypothetical protein